MAVPPVPALDPDAFVNTYYRKPNFFRDGRLSAHNYFGIARIEDVVHDFQLPVPLNRTTYYAILFVRRGWLTRTDGLNSYQLTANTVYFDSPGQLFATEAVAADCRGYFVLFDAEYFLHHLRDANTLLALPFFQLDQNPTVTLPAAEANELHGLMQQMERYYHRPELPDQHALLSTLLYLFCLRAKPFCQAIPTGEASAAEVLTYRFKNLLKAHILTKRSVRAYADLLHVTPDYLSKTVKRVTGQTAGDFITAVVVLEARVLLRQTTLTVSEIAFHLGIEDLSYFARLIKKHTGYTPSEYRRQA